MSRVRHPICVLEGSKAQASGAEAGACRATRIAEWSLEDLFTNGEILQAEGCSDDLLKLYQRWLAVTQDPRRHLAQFNLGSLLQGLGRLEEALTAYDECLRLAPEFGRALINKGLVLESLGRHSAAIEAWKTVTSQRYSDSNPEVELSTTALNHIGRLQENLKRYELAEVALEDSLRLNPRQPGVIQHWFHIRQKACEWPVARALPGLTPNGVLMATSPLGQLALSDDPVEQLLVAQAFVQRTYPTQSDELPKPAVHANRRLRLGYVSGDLCVHAVGLLLADLLEEHDRSQFEVFAYDYSPEDGSEHRTRLLRAFDHVRDIRAATDTEAATLIAQDDIDVLIDLHGLSSGARPGLFRLKPAPLQGTWLGFIGTTAMPWYDFVIADRQVLPPELRRYVCEEPLYVEGSFIPLSSTAEPLRSFTRQDLSLPEAGFVMAAFGNSYKINRELFEQWVQLLKELPGSVLWLIDDNPSATRNLRKQAQRSGIDPDRLVFTPRVSPTDFKSYLRLADVFLDTYPYNCGSTTRDVLAAGLPMITISGRSMVSRMGASILASVGLDHCIARDFDSYRQMVVNLAHGGISRADCSVSTKDLNNSRMRLLRSLERELLTRWHQQGHSAMAR